MPRLTSKYHTQVQCLLNSNEDAFNYLSFGPLKSLIEDVFLSYFRNLERISIRGFMVHTAAEV